MSLLDRIDEAHCIDELHSFLRVIPLEEVKAFLRNRIVNLENNIDDNNELIVESCDEIKRLSLSIISITDILPTDIMMKTIDYLTNDHRKYLPILSKSFKIIMNNPILYRKYRVYIVEPEPNTTTNPYYFRSSPEKTKNPQEMHVYAEHRRHGGSIMIKSMTKRSRKVEQLAHVPVFESSLPWKNSYNLIINGCRSFDNSDQSISMTNSHILRVLMEMKEIKHLGLQSFFTLSRLSSYPTFNNVYCLDLGEIEIDLKNNPDLKTWLNSKTFPVLTVLTIPLFSGSNAMNDVLESLNIRVLKLVRGTFVRNEWRLKMPKSLEFLSVGQKSTSNNKSNFMDQLDLSKCDKLIGMRVNVAIPFESIIWNQSHPLLYINVDIDKYHWERPLLYNIKKPKHRWYEGYKNDKIHSQFVIGRCFFEENEMKTVPIKCNKCGYFRFDEKKINEKDITQKCIRRMSIPFDIIIEYIQSSEYYNVHCILEILIQRHISHMSMNYPRVSERTAL